MPRRVSTGRVGRPILGDIFTQDNSIRSVETNANLVLQPDGTGVVVSESDIQTNAQAGIRFADSDSSNYVLLRGPATTSNITLTLPNAVGSNNQILASDGSGNLSFADTAVAIANRSAADDTEYLITMTTATSGTESTFSVADNDRLKFVPDPGLLTVNSISTTSISAGTADINGGTIDGASLGSSSAISSATITTVDINGGAIDGTNIGAVVAGTGRFTTLTETSSITYKENINPITNALDAVLQLAGVTYDRKDGSTKNEAGLIAEDVAPVIPNVVTYKDGKPEGINYTKLSAYLIEAVKTLKDEIDQLKGSK